MTLAAPRPMNAVRRLALLLVLKQEQQRTGRPATPSLLVAPASLLANWAAEAQRFAPDLRVLLAHPSALPASTLRSLDAESFGDVDLVEINEAFAAQALGCVRDLEIDQARLNVNGGAIALGHPLGSSGARIVATLVYELRRRGARRGLATMCIGVGQGIAGLFER